MPRGSRNPFDEFEAFLERMSRQLDEGPWRWGVEAAPLDVIDEGDAYRVEVELPGFEREELDVTMGDGRLRVRAEHEQEHENEDVDVEREENEGSAIGGPRYVRRERQRRSVDRRVSLPEEVSAEAVTATYDRGVLTVHLPKVGSGDSHQIEID